MPVTLEDLSGLTGNAKALAITDVVGLMPGRDRERDVFGDPWHSMLEEYATEKNIGERLSEATAAEPLINVATIKEAGRGVFGLLEQRYHATAENRSLGRWTGLLRICLPVLAGTPQQVEDLRQVMGQLRHANLGILEPTNNLRSGWREH